MYIFINPSIHSWIHPLIHPSIHPLIHPSIYWSIHPSIHLSVVSPIDSSIHSSSSLIKLIYSLCYDNIHYLFEAIYAFGLLLDGKINNIYVKLQEQWFNTVIANLSVWIPVQLLNFRYILPQYQVLFSNVIGLFWNIYISKSLSSSSNSNSNRSNVDNGDDDDSDSDDDNSESKKDWHHKE